jgi:hypothetical protein
MLLDYTLCSIHKNVRYDIPDKFYNSSEVVKIIKGILTAVDHTIKEKENENGNK